MISCVHPQVNIYVDAVINHMCGAGGGEGTHSSCGSWFSATHKDFPSVPFSHWDFNDNKCKTGSGDIENYGDANQVTLQTVDDHWTILNLQRTNEWTMITLC